MGDLTSTNISSLYIWHIVEDTRTQSTLEGWDIDNMDTSGGGFLIILLLGRGWEN